ncbi:MAG: hypothetical protein IPO21_07940 [Bacteroidales bacterium]|nr:hypothetical protein [Bacteroidales bacterium]
MKKIIFAIIILSTFSCDRWIYLDYEFKNKTSESITCELYNNDSIQRVIKINSNMDSIFYDVQVPYQSGDVLSFPYDSAVIYGLKDSVVIMTREDTLDNSIFKEKNWNKYIQENGNKTLTYTFE